MRAGKAVNLLLLSFLCMAPRAHAETGEQGWLRYAALPPQATQQYKKMPQHVAGGGRSAVSRSAASELVRGLHSMLGENVTVSSALPNEDSFVLGTPTEIQRLLPTWKLSSPLAPEGFSLAQFAAQGHSYWVLAGGTDRGELYGVFRILELVAQQKQVGPNSEAPVRPFAGSTSGTTSTEASNAAMPGAAFSSTVATCVPTLPGSRRMAVCWPRLASTASRSTT